MNPDKKFELINNIGYYIFMAVNILITVYQLTVLRNIIVFICIEIIMICLMICFNRLLWYCYSKMTEKKEKVMYSENQGYL